MKNGISQNGISQSKSTLDILPVEVMKEHTAMVMTSSQDPLLLSILNKAIEGMDSGVLNSSLVEHTFATRYQMTFSDFVYKFRTQIIAIGSLILLIFILLLYVILSRRKHQALLQKKNEDLARAVTAAERANIAKSQFLSRMSHEIRTPMNAIVGLSTIARTHDTEPEKVDEYLTKIDSSSKVLLSIINDVLDMSAIENEKMKIANTEFDLRQLLTTVSNIYYTQCKNKGVDFKMGIDITEETVIGDSLRVNQIMMNLISNAYKFTDKGGTIEVEVKETNRKDKTVFIRFSVKDTGCGMSEDMLARLFQPFEQESADTAKKAGGSGLGMSITKNLVELMHGAIQVQSVKGEGSTFTVDLPFEITGHQTGIDPEKLKKMKVLVVDDDASERLYTGVVLKRIGVNYDMAETTDEAIEKIAEQEKTGTPYDICFTDWKMPGKNGVELTRHIRENYGDNTLIIIVSAYDLSEVQDEAKAAGANMFITKPLFQSTVFNVMAEVTGGVVKKTEEHPDQYDFTGHKVLLAEDNEMNTEVAIEILGLVNMAVDHAENGKIAVDMFNAAKPGTYDAILMDIQMPVMDGYTAAKEIRALDHPEAKTMPIYAMTADAFTEDISTALSAGMNGHISKPIDTKVLYQTLYKVCNKQA